MKEENEIKQTHKFVQITPPHISDVTISKMAMRSDDPPNSRLFILCQKGITEEKFQETFGQYGKVEDIWIVKDKRTNEDRGKSMGMQ